MSWEHGTRFEVTGVVTRVWDNGKGTFAKLTVEAPNGRGGVSKIDFKAFSESVDAVRHLGYGQTVKVTGTVAMEKLTNKAKDEIKVDGYSFWYPTLRIGSVEVEPASTKPAATGHLGADSGDGW